MARRTRIVERSATIPIGDPVPAERWLCSGMKRHGNGTISPCHRVLMETVLTAGSFIRIRCPECGTWATREAVVSRDTEPTVLDEG